MRPARLRRSTSTLAAVAPDKRALLERLRRTIKAAVPTAEECISYGLPAFRLDGRMLVWFGAAAHHCAIYPGAVVADLADRLRDFDTSKGTVRFTPEKPLPASVVRMLLKARIARGGVKRRQV